MGVVEGNLLSEQVVALRDCGALYSLPCTAFYRPGGVRTNQPFSVSSEDSHQFLIPALHKSYINKSTINRPDTWLLVYHQLGTL